MEFVIIATVVLVLAMCLGADFGYSSYNVHCFSCRPATAIFGFFVYSCCKTYWNEKQ